MTNELKATQIELRRRIRNKKAARKAARRKAIAKFFGYGLVCLVLAWYTLSYAEILIHNDDALDGEPHVYSKYNCLIVFDKVFDTHALDEVPHN